MINLARKARNATACQRIALTVLVRE